MSCQPSDKNLPLYFQNILPSVSPTLPQNKILYSTTGSIPSYIPLNRIWNFLCNGTFTGNQIVLFFDASSILQECSQYNIRFEGKINGQLTIKKKDYPVQKYVSKTLVYDSRGRVSGIRFTITKPECLSAGKTVEFYLNVYVNDSDTTTNNTYGIYFASNLTTSTQTLQYTFSYSPYSVNIPPSSSTCFFQADSFTSIQNLNISSVSCSTSYSTSSGPIPVPVFNPPVTCPNQITINVPYTLCQANNPADTQPVPTNANTVCSGLMGVSVDLVPPPTCTGSVPYCGVCKNADGFPPNCKQGCIDFPGEVVTNSIQVYPCPSGYVDTGTTCYQAPQNYNNFIFQSAPSYNVPNLSTGVVATIPYSLQAQCTMGNVETNIGIISQIIIADINPNNQYTLNITPENLNQNVSTAPIPPYVQVYNYTQNSINCNITTQINNQTYYYSLNSLQGVPFGLESSLSPSALLALEFSAVAVAGSVIGSAVATFAAVLTLGSAADAVSFFSTLTLWTGSYLSIVASTTLPIYTGLLSGIISDVIFGLSIIDYSPPNNNNIPLTNSCYFPFPIDSLCLTPSTVPEYSDTNIYICSNYNVPTSSGYGYSNTVSTSPLQNYVVQTSSGSPCTTGNCVFAITSTNVQQVQITMYLDISNSSNVTTSNLPQESFSFENLTGSTLSLSFLIYNNSSYQNNGCTTAIYAPPGNPQPLYQVVSIPSNYAAVPTMTLAPNGFYYATIGVVSLS